MEVPSVGGSSEDCRHREIRKVAPVGGVVMSVDEEAALKTVDGARSALLTSFDGCSSIDRRAMEERVMFVHSQYRNACLQECILALACGRWRRRLRRMLGFAFTNDDGSGLGGGVQERFNFHLTDAMLCAAH